ncbi:MAG: ester cyclase [Bacteroidia bacterium]|nr:ester cyclase [Bacteroidia bacterium]
MGKEELKEMIVNYYQSLDLYKGDISKMNDVYNEDMLVYFVGTPAGFTAKDFLEPSKSYYVAFPDLKHRVEDVIVDGNSATCRVVAEGTHLGPFQGVEATNKPISVEAIVAFKVRDKKFSEQRISADMLGLMLTIGAVKK